jgi:hypothetical protein
VAENSADIAKRIILGCIAEGMTVDAACASAGKSMKTYEYYRRTDKVFADKMDRTRLGLKDKAFASNDVHDISFAEFRERFLNSKTFAHQQNIVDVIEGREPSWLHSSMKYEPGLSDNRILINIPPNHAKSMTITVDYVTWQVARNPNFRVLIVSQTQRLASDFLYAIKQRLTHPMYQDLQSAYAAGVGFNSKSASWQATRITFGDELRESGEKDPNIEAVGIGGQIYGKRADMIIVDDAVTLSNANDFERQIKWLTQDVRSRLNPTGKLIIIGTRVASVDLYKELRNEDRYPGGQVPWKYLAMPALLTVDEDPDKWETLWPYSDAPFDGQEENELQFKEHHTGSNKWDSGFGVASMSTLFGTKQFDGKHHRDNLIHLPSDQTENVKALIEQLITWTPTTKGKTDMVMALWFCEIRAREMINYGNYATHHMKNPFLSRHEIGKRTVINLDEAFAEQNRMKII